MKESSRFALIVIALLLCVLFVVQAIVLLVK
nr:MAG TPA: hypothetical protein [Caudoviricetes sp.]